MADRSEARDRQAATLPATERRSAVSAGIDALPDADALTALFEGQARALDAVRAAIPALADLAALAVARLEAGGRLLYVAAGSPALIALGDALEIPQTYGEPPERFRVVIAGGRAMTETLLGGPEDDASAAAPDLAAAGLSAGDCVVGISASGTTRYTVAALQAARAAGAATGAIANNPATPLLAAADVAVTLDSGPEVIAGSTRMGAGTAQKAALNMLSTLIAIRLGHVHDGHMVNVRADNAKLRERAARMVADIAAVGPQEAAAALAAADGEVKTAVLVAAGVGARDAAALLARHHGRLRPAFEAARRQAG